MGLAEVEEKPLTVPRPFNLTKPNPRKVPEPMKIEQVKPTEASNILGGNWGVYRKQTPTEKLCPGRQFGAHFLRRFCI